jgi:hypothetical protein
VSCVCVGCSADGLLAQIHDTLGSLRTSNDHTEIKRLLGKLQTLLSTYIAQLQTDETTSQTNSDAVLATHNSHAPELEAKLTKLRARAARLEAHKLKLASRASANGAALESLHAELAKVKAQRQQLMDDCKAKHERHVTEAAHRSKEAEIRRKSSNRFVVL